jgi:uncharacterized protein YecT (DUF1311 family)
MIKFLLAALLLFSSPLASLHASAAGADLNAADAELNKTYQKLLSSISDPAEKALLVTAQKAWLKDRDTNVALYATRYQFSKGGLFFNIYLIKERTKFLAALLGQPGGEAEGVSAYEAD